MRAKESFNIAAAVCAVVSFLLLMLPVTTLVHSIRAVLTYTLYPSLYAGERADYFLRHVPANISSILSADKENRALREQIKNLQTELENARTLSYETERLLGEMKLRKNYKWKGTWARVVGRDNKNWYGFLTVGKGSEDGVNVNDTAVYFGGDKAALAGRVYEVYPHFSKIMLVGNKAFSIIASLISGEDLLAEGSGSAGMKIEYIPSALKIEEGQELFSSQSATLYLPNISVGTISKIYKKDSFIGFTSADIKFSADLDAVKELYIVSHKLPEDLIPISEEQL